MIILAWLRGDIISRIIDDGHESGYFWQDDNNGSWYTMNWYRTERGAKIAASRHYGEKLQWYAN